ncbi:uncharacterized protein LOC133887234 isoform X2 [Phragmites australis]|uniref:uncharacterized protein LOC133887234 isoform X2 n=1 Tax=Phragmites australis TaxID=29695 RepID=UPI002D777363|nr:uncharacterized protein LOC133887234 isoform X2 [Phragmites australis]
MEAGEQRQRASVPAFGGWEGGALPDYSLDFSKIRAARMQRRKALSWSSFAGGWEDEEQQRSPAAGGGGSEDRERRRHRRQHSDATEARLPLRPGRAAPKGRSKFKGYFFGCMGRW